MGTKLKVGERNTLKLNENGLTFGKRLKISRKALYSKVEKNKEKSNVFVYSGFRNANVFECWIFGLGVILVDSFLGKAFKILRNILDLVSKKSSSSQMLQNPFSESVLSTRSRDA